MAGLWQVLTLVPTAASWVTVTAPRTVEQGSFRGHFVRGGGAQRQEQSATCSHPSWRTPSPISPAWGRAWPPSGHAGPHPSSPSLVLGSGHTSPGWTCHFVPSFRFQDHSQRARSEDS